MPKSACIWTVLARAYTIQVLNPWYLQKKFGSRQWSIEQCEFRIWITRRIWNRIWKKCSKMNRGPNMLDWWIKPEDKNLTLLSLQRCNSYFAYRRINKIQEFSLLARKCTQFARGCSECPPFAYKHRCNVAADYVLHHYYWRFLFQKYV